MEMRQTVIGNMAAMTEVDDYTDKYQPSCKYKWCCIAYTFVDPSNVTNFKGMLTPEGSVVLKVLSPFVVFPFHDITVKVIATNQRSLHQFSTIT